MFHRPLRRYGALLAVVQVLGVPSSPAAASPCLETVLEMAERHQLSTKVAERSPSAITPPTGDEAAVIEPRPRNGGVMETAPPLSAPRGPAGLHSPLVDPERRARVESLLIAARRYAEGGEERRCAQRLDEARTLVKVR